MATDAPTILATSGGYRDHDRLRFQFGDLVHYAVELSGASAVVPRVCNVGTAWGDDPRYQMDMSEAGRLAGFNLTQLSLFPMPNLDDMQGHLMAQHVVWVNGGSVANLLAVWRVHYDSEPRRRPLVHRLVADGTLGTTHCTDDGVGMLYRGTEFVEAVSEEAGKAAYVVRREGDRAVEERLETRLLGRRSPQPSTQS